MPTIEVEVYHVYHVWWDFVTDTFPPTDNDDDNDDDDDDDDDDDNDGMICVRKQPHDG